MIVIDLFSMKFGEGTDCFGLYRGHLSQEWRYETSLEEPKRLPPLFELNDRMWDYSYRSAGGKIVSTSRGD